MNTQLNLTGERDHTVTKLDQSMTKDNADLVGLLLLKSYLIQVTSLSMKKPHLISFLFNIYWTVTRTLMTMPVKVD